MDTELMGRLVHLRPLSEADMRQRAVWTADAELLVLMGADPAEEPFVSPENERQRNIAWLRNRQQAGDQLYAIEADGRYIGDIDVVFLTDDHKAELTVFLGDRSAWSMGYGTDSVSLVLEELCAEPGVDCVDVDVPTGNDRGLGFWQKLGFEPFKTEDGVRWLRRSLQQ